MVHIAQRILLTACCGLLVSLMSTSSSHASYTCDVALHLDTTAAVEMIEFRVDYARVQGRFSTTDAANGDGATVRGVSCHSAVPRTSIIQRDSCAGSYSECQWGDDRALSLVVSNPYGMRGRAEMEEALGHTELATCTFVTDEPLETAPFAIRVVSSLASMEGLREPSAPPVIEASITACRADSD